MGNQVLIVGQPGLNAEVAAVFGVDGTEGIHQGELSTKYYDAAVGVFVDETADFAQWFQEFMSDDARELRDYLQGIVVTVGNEAEAAEVSKWVEQLSNQLDEEYIEDHPSSDEFQWEGFKVVVGRGDPEGLEKLVLGTGFDAVSLGDTRKIDDELVGMARLESIVESTRWEHLVQKPEPGYLPEDLETTLSRIEAAKARASALPQEERKKYVKETVKKLMNEL